MNAADNKKDNHLAGSVYDLYAAPKDAARPANEWNQTRILAKGNHVEHWLNGKKVASYDVGSADWNAAIKASKFDPREISELRESGEGLSRHPGRSSRHAGTTQYQDSRAAVDETGPPLAGSSGRRPSFDSLPRG